MLRPYVSFATWSICFDLLSPPEEATGGGHRRTYDGDLNAAGEGRRGGGGGATK